MPIFSAHMGTGLLPPVQTPQTMRSTDGTILPPVGFISSTMPITPTHQPPQPNRPPARETPPPQQEDGEEDIVFLKLPPPPTGILEAPYQTGAALTTQLPTAAAAFDAAGVVNLRDLKIKKEKKPKQAKIGERRPSDRSDGNQPEDAPKQPTPAHELTMQIEDTQRKYNAESVPASPREATATPAVAEETPVGNVVASPPPGLPSSFIASSTPLPILPNAAVQQENIELGKQEEVDFRAFINTLIQRDESGTAKIAPGTPLTAGTTTNIIGDLEPHDAFLERLLTQQQAMFQLHQEVLTRNHVETTTLMRDLVQSRVAQAASPSHPPLDGEQFKGGLTALQQSKLLTESMDQRDKLMRMNDELLRLQAQQAALQHPGVIAPSQIPHSSQPTPRPSLWVPPPLHDTPLTESARRTPGESVLRASSRSASVTAQQQPQAAILKDARVGSSMVIPTHGSMACNTSNPAALDAGIQAGAELEPGAPVGMNFLPVPHEAPPQAPGPTPAQLTDQLEQAANELAGLTEELNRTDTAALHVEGVLRDSRALLERRKLHSASDSQQEQQAMLRALRQQASEIESQLSFVQRYPREIAPSLRNSVNASGNNMPQWLPSNDLSNAPVQKGPSSLPPPSPRRASVPPLEGSVRKAAALNSLNTSAVARVPSAVSLGNNSISLSKAVSMVPDAAASHELVMTASEPAITKEGNWEVLVPAHYKQKEEHRHQPPLVRPVNHRPEEVQPRATTKAGSPQQDRPQTASHGGIYSMASLIRPRPQSARVKSATRSNTPTGTASSSAAVPKQFSMYGQPQPRIHAFHPGKLDTRPSSTRGANRSNNASYISYNVPPEPIPIDRHNTSTVTDHGWELRDQRRFQIADKYSRRQHDLLEDHTGKRLEQLKLDLQGI